MTIIHGFIKLLDSYRFSYLFIGLFILYGAILQWLLQVDVLVKILTSGIGFSQIFDVFVQAFFDLFRLGFDFTPVMIILNAFFLSLATIYRVRVVRRIRLSMKTFFPLVASGCIACGGSLVFPVLSSVVGDLSREYIQIVGEVFFLIATYITYTEATKAIDLYESN